MSESFVDLMFLAFFGSVLFGVAGVGILALPWKDDELADTTRAIRHAWRRLDDALRLVTAPATPPRAPRHDPAFRRRYVHDGPSVAFEPPSMPA